MREEHRRGAGGGMQGGGIPPLLLALVALVLPAGLFFLGGEPCFLGGDRGRGLGDPIPEGVTPQGPPAGGVRGAEDNGPSTPAGAGGARRGADSVPLSPLSPPFCVPALPRTAQAEEGARAALELRFLDPAGRPVAGVEVVLLDAPPPRMVVRSEPWRGGPPGAHRPRAVTPPAGPPCHAPDDPVARPAPAVAPAPVARRQGPVHRWGRSDAAGSIRWADVPAPGRVRWVLVSEHALLAPPAFPKGGDDPPGTRRYRLPAPPGADFALSPGQHAVADYVVGPPERSPEVAQLDPR